MMKKIIALLFFTLLTSCLSAQSLCGLKIEKGAKVNYHYLNFRGEDSLIVSKTLLNWPIPGELDFDDHIEDITTKIFKNGFQYDNQNDTVLLASYFGRLRVYTKNHRYQYICNNVKFEVADLKLTKGTLENDFAIYRGDIDKVKTNIENRGYVLTFGAGYAIRFIIKDGKIQYPFDFWRYYYVQ
jgi:lipoprotein